MDELKQLLRLKNEELKDKDELIDLLEKEVNEREETILYLKNEIDKFRQIVDLGKVAVPKQVQKLKRQAISAEPLEINAQNKLKDFAKVEKSEEYIIIFYNKFFLLMLKIAAYFSK